MNEKSYNEILDGLVEILQKRLTSDSVLKFKDLLKTLKSVYGVEVTREFLKGFFPNEHALQHNITTRINRVIKRAEIKTADLLRFYSEQQSEHGSLYYCYKKQVLKRLIV